MSSVLKISLHGGLKRLISSLICVSMILSTFPLLLLKSMVCAGDDDTITITVNNLNNLNSLNNNLSTNSLTGKSIINISISDPIAIAESSTPTMTIGGGKRYFFDFSNDRFNNKTIDISGNSITISNPNLFFLCMKYGTVNLENITIDGKKHERQGAFIDVEKSGDSTPILNVGKGVTIQDCINKGQDGGLGKDGEDALGGAIYCKGGQVTIGVGSGTALDKNAKITSCQAIGGNGGNGGDGGNVDIYKYKIVTKTKTPCLDGDPKKVETTVSYEIKNLLDKDGEKNVNKIKVYDEMVQDLSYLIGSAVMTGVGVGAILIGAAAAITVGSGGALAFVGLALAIIGAILLISELDEDRKTAMEVEVYCVDGIWYPKDFRKSKNEDEAKIIIAQKGNAGQKGQRIEKETVPIIGFYEEGGGGGGAICIEDGELRLMDGLIDTCSSNERGSNIFIGPYVKCNFSTDLIINTPQQFTNPNDQTRKLSVDDLQKYYNSPKDKTLGYPGIYCSGYFRQAYYKLVFVDADNPSEKLYVQDFATKRDGYTVPNRLGYKLNELTYGDDNTKISLKGANTFDLNDDIINTEKNWVITLKAKYDKLYTIRYICKNKLITSISDQLLDDLNVNFFNPWVHARGDNNFAPNLGYELSTITYSRDNVPVPQEGLTPDNLISQADDNVITFMINHAPKQYNLEYVDEDKDSMTVKDLEGNKASSQQVKFGDDIKTMTPSDEKLGYDFKCWHVLDKDGNELIDSGSSEPIDFETAKANWETLATAAGTGNTIRLKAVYTPKKYTIKYNARSNDPTRTKEFYIGQDNDHQLNQPIAEKYLLKTSTNRYTDKNINNKNLRYYSSGETYNVKSGSTITTT